MPSRAPSYYHWSQDKPCTTNQVYGFGLEPSDPQTASKKPVGPFDYTRPFSNSAFFPQISSSGAMMTSRRQGALRTGSGGPCGGSGQPSKRRFDINRGYQMGYTPISEKVVKNPSVPIGVRLDRGLSAPPSVYQYPSSRARELFLWHTLSGSLVHVKHHPADPENGA